MRKTVGNSFVFSAVIMAHIRGVEGSSPSTATNSSTEDFVAKRRFSISFMLCA